MFKALINFPVYDKREYKEFKKGDEVVISEEGLLAKLIKSGRCEKVSDKKSEKIETKVQPVEENKKESPKPRAKRQPKKK